jgi:hypothetical protein
MKVTDVIKEADPKKEFISIEKGDVNLVMVFDHDALVKKNEKKIVRLYKLGDDEETVEPIDSKMMIESIISAIKDDVDVVDLLQEVLENTPPDLLIKSYQGVMEQSDIDIGSEPEYHCCYSVLIRTKERVLEIPISGGRYDRTST